MSDDYDSICGTGPGPSFTPVASVVGGFSLEARIDGVVFNSAADLAEAYPQFKPLVEGEYPYPGTEGLAEQLGWA